MPMVLARVAALCAALAAMRAQAQTQTSTPTPTAPQAEAVESEESDLSETPERKIIKDWNEYDFKYFTFKWGIFTLLDWGIAAQNKASTSQIDVPRDFAVRDFRLTFSGRFAFERPVTYTMGLMYDGPTNEWFPRETGIQIGIPELWGNLFLGRQKEGISLNKITVGYAVWTMERMPITDASIPIMADGIKWLGNAPNNSANWNLAYYHNTLAKSPSKGWYDDAVVARFAVVPLHPAEDQTGSLLHLGVAYHWGKYSKDQAQLRSRPESFTAGYFLDTGKFPATENHFFGGELYYRNNSWLAGAEYYFNLVRAPGVHNPLFHGGEAFVAWLVTGEIRPYVDVGGKLGFVKPLSSAFEGGTGALELVFHGSYTDLDSGLIEGGRFWRLTPEIHWYLDSLVTLRANYGLGFLDRFGKEGWYHFFQARLQIQID